MENIDKTYRIQGRCDMAEFSEQNEKIEKIARDVLILSRNTLLVNLRFMDAALSQFELISCGKDTFLTDGKHLIYNPKHILWLYKSEKEIVTRGYLHIVLHCIFRHMYGALNMNQDVWNLACDIAVEAIIAELDLRSTAAMRGNEQKKTLDELKKKIGKLTAEKIYRCFMDQCIERSEIAKIRSQFYVDNHELWYWTTDKANAESLNSGERGNQKAKTGVQASCDDSSSKGNSGNPGSQDVADASNASSSQAQTWKKIAERMQVELEVLQKKRGDTPGSMMQNLLEVNRERYDYTEFLRKFAVRSEIMKINDDEFDYIYYTYGLELYEKMPLIEPLEYKETKRIREFVIAIDTSGSVMGEEVQCFVQKTYNVLKSTESFSSRINLHIIQCDADIQEHVKIASQEEFDIWIRTMTIKGLGGTDFRPVFSKVNEMVEQREFLNLKGLIYFTDGYGLFPEQKPPYETAFVFVNDEYTNPRVPSWAIKLVMQKSEI